jgi:hypothetical protein
MIICKPYNATFDKPDTCILRQTELAEILKKNKEIDKRVNAGGTGQLKYNSYPVRYFALQKCHGCEVGLELYRKSLSKPKEEEKVMNGKKTCGSCGMAKEATREYFDYAPKGKYQLTKDCRVCRGTAPGMEKPRKLKIVPVAAADPVEETPAVKIPDPVKTAVCPECGKEKELSVDFFYVNSSSKTGLESVCKTCRNLIKKRAREEQQKNLVLDIGSYPVILGQLEAAAADNMRTPEAQALWMLKGALVGESSK